MIYIDFPRDIFADNNVLKIWNGGRKSDRGMLIPYLQEHTTIENSLGKDWYSEAHQEGESVIQVDHYRPKNDAQPVRDMTKSNSPEARFLLTNLENSLGFSLPQSTDAPNGEYNWLDNACQNFRLSFTGTNRPKTNFFPILVGTNRLIDQENPWDGDIEYPLLLDPCFKEDCGLLEVLEDGTICPAYGPESLPTDFYTDPKKYWSTNLMKYIRAWTSIYVYRLNHFSFEGARSLQIKSVISYLTIGAGLVRIGKPFPKAAFKAILNLMNASSRYSLAVRSYMAYHYNPPSNLSSVQIHAMHTVRDKLIKAIFILEGPHTTFPKPEKLEY